MTSPPNAVNDLPNINQLGKGDPFYKTWHSAWHTARALFTKMGDTGAPVLRINELKQWLNHVLVRPEYLQTYRDAQLLYNEAFTPGRERLFEVPDDPPTFTLDDALKDLDTPDQYRPESICTSALVITGQPGIGKTVFLWYVLVRRLANHEMVVYQDNPDFFYIFHQGGVTKVPSNSDAPRVRKVLSFSTWCLLDANPHMRDGVPFVVKLGRFIIQAASPNALRKNWFEKNGKLYTEYIMKPMSLEEVLLCRSCLANPRKSIEDVKKGYNLYGPSTWVALHCYNTAWKAKLDRAFVLLGTSTTLLAEIMNNLAVAIDRHPDISSKILLVKPGKFRHEPHVGVLTKHVFDLLMDWVKLSLGSRVGAFHSTMEKGSKGARSLAGQIFEATVHDCDISSETAGDSDTLEEY